MELNTLLQYKPYSTARTEKRALYAGLLTELTQFHREHCPEYGRLLDALGCPAHMDCTVENTPMLPVSLFKELELFDKIVEATMAVSLLDNCGTALDAVELIAVAAGPGSFTGLRIGVAAAKGLAWPGNKPCAACSTLESMAWCLAHLDGEICAVMDARRNQVYNARFRAAGGRLERLCPDRAVGLDALADELKKSGNPQFLVGDGALLCYTTLKEMGLDIRLAPPHLRHQSAWGVARCALELTRAGRLTDAAGLTPNYHRLSQAERERLEKEQHKGESCHGHGKSTHFGPPSAAAQAVHPAG